jgi:hypothetical protein
MMNGLRDIIKQAFTYRYNTNRLKCFEDRCGGKSFTARNCGARLAPLDRIVGSVGRSNDFDGRFRLRNHLPSDRFRGIKTAMHEGKSLPPVNLYQIENEYYVMDGNHRVAAAKALGRQFINACIVKLVLSKNGFENNQFRDKEVKHV